MDGSPKQKFLVIAAWCVLVITVPFALYAMILPCQQMDIGGASSYIKEVAPKRIPWFLFGALACSLALAAMYFLAKPSYRENSPSKTAYGCGLGCLGLILFVLIWLIFGYLNS